jgi:hypothetical protein
MICKTTSNCIAIRASGTRRELGGGDIVFPPFNQIGSVKILSIQILASKTSFSGSIFSKSFFL